MKVSSIIAALLAVTGAVEAKTCTVQSSNGQSDDSPAIAKALVECAEDSVIIFSEGIDYNVFNPVNASDLSNVTINMQGNLHLSQNITHMQ